jgi:RNA polymerase sigma-70 factor (ECF subfamily)
MVEFQRGDDGAFRRLVLHYGERIAAFFRRAGADAASAEDLAQEAFLRVARARDRYEPTARFTTWLHRILFRMAMNDRQRNRWRRAVPIAPSRRRDESEPAHPEPMEERRSDPAEAVSLLELRERVRGAVADLPEPQRTALLLHRFEGCSYDEVGAALELSLPAVKSLLFRARENVRKRLLPLLAHEVNHGLP